MISQHSKTLSSNVSTVSPAFECVTGGRKRPFFTLSPPSFRSPTYFGVCNVGQGRFFFFFFFLFFFFWFLPFFFFFFLVSDQSNPKQLLLDKLTRTFSLTIVLRFSMFKWLLKTLADQNVLPS